MPPQKRWHVRTSSFLSSQVVSNQVLSTYECLTTVFGMGTGGSTQLSPLDFFVEVAVNVSQSCGALRACILGTFSHTSCFRIDCTLAGLSLRQLSSGQRQPIMRRASRLHSWDVFAYDLLPNRLRLLDRSAYPQNYTEDKNILGGKT